MVKYYLDKLMMSNSKNPGLYIHVPFCRTKCPYCDFYSATSLPLVPDWLDGLRREVLIYKDRFAAFDSLYLGGGTPTLLAGRELTTLMDGLFRHLTFSSDTEITIEANPDDITLEKLALLRDLGTNRISLGVQSFDDGELQYLGRRHTARQTEKALEWIRTSGFTNVGVDLMYGFTGQTEAVWVQTMKHTLDFEPEHLSCYQMTLEEGTPFGKMLAEGRIKPLEEEKERDFFLLTSRFLEEHGYLHYEISNFARSKAFFSRHNQKYWQRIPYLGLGPSAHSFQDGVRWWNHSSIRRYCRALAEGKSPVDETETLSTEQLRLESLYLGFRTRDGVSIETLHNSSPRSDQILSRLQESGLVRVLQNRALPTREGFAVADRLPLLFSE
ncbi:MAG: radical SAM family heme chaperone HemW [Deltaproteobacteria bacterium]|nr:radical SAM family heme chaperone HemW [Deltaproteobacteria bacterium]